MKCVIYMKPCNTWIMVKDLPFLCVVCVRANVANIKIAYLPCLFPLLWQQSIFFFLFHSSMLLLLDQKKNIWLKMNGRKSAIKVMWAKVKLFNEKLKFIGLETNNVCVLYTFFPSILIALEIFFFPFSLNWVLIYAKPSRLPWLLYRRYRW